MGIGSILSLLAIVGFVIGIIGIVLTVMAASQGRPFRGSVSLAAIGFVMGLIFVFAGTGLLEVGVTEVAVIYNPATGQLSESRGPGISIIVPGLQQYTIYPTNEQEYTISGSRKSA